MDDAASAILMTECQKTKKELAEFSPHFCSLGFLGLIILVPCLAKLICLSWQESRVCHQVVRKIVVIPSGRGANWCGQLEA